MTIKVAEEQEAEAQAEGSVLSWVGELRRVSQAVSKTAGKAPASRQQIHYALHWSAHGERFGVVVLKGRDPENAEECWALDRVLSKPSSSMTDEDLAVFRMLWDERDFDCGLRAFGLGPRFGAECLRRMAQTGRLCPASDFSPLHYVDEARPASLAWRTDELGRQRPLLKPEPAADLVIPVQPPWFVDFDEGIIGPLAVPGRPEAVARLFAMPPLTAEHARSVVAALAADLPDLPVPAEAACAGLRHITSKPIAVLRLQTIGTHGNKDWRGYPASEAHGEIDIARPAFQYQDAEVKPGDVKVCYALESGETVTIERRDDFERELMSALTACGLVLVPSSVLHTFGAPPDDAFSLEAETGWPGFMRDAVPLLRAAGWQVEFDDDFRHYQQEVESWDAELIEADAGWFDLDMGIIVDGERLPLAPLLAGLFHRDTRWLDSYELRQIPDDESIELRTPENRRIRVEAARLKPLAATLIDLFDGFSGGRLLRISRFDTQRLAVLNDSRRWLFRGQRDVFALAERLQSAQGVAGVAPPAGLGLELRGYQVEGLSWLQFLREQGLAGILADDMGLGKTAQALAHLLVEKEAGRLDRPALIVLPTSLIFNWKNEAARCAPSLSILSLHGAERKAYFEAIPQHDVVLTTYPLLWRDALELTKHRYHVLILDEAQTVKNARSQGAEVVRKIDARHRVCLTGTPLENHLGELWSQFDFLLPGFLGSSQSFTRYWRTPIEKQGDHERRDLLARRIRPFVLRRRKEEVARELPAKTVIVRKVELAGSQRDLYEAVRAAMDAMVREEVGRNGFGRSQILILDALLKLRQVCCDPRLVKATLAQRVTERAKLELLMTMLPEQVEEGRRILLFSQFTSMLALIEAELQQIGLSYVKLTGDTADRETPVKQFQAGEVPIFLISLKAGGVGLNLTAADTVIHFDPWWNPAVENQATDRAHRIGQDKPVFVYKLIVAGSIEERILSLQERKANLSAGVLAVDRGIDLKFGEDDLAALFAPLPS